MPMILSSSMQTFVDLTDQRKLSCYLTANLPSVQIKDPNTGVLNPNWVSTNLVITPVIFIENTRLVLGEAGSTGLSVTWKRREGSGSVTAIVSSNGETAGTNGNLTVNKNTLESIPSGLLSYICEVNFNDPETLNMVSITSELSFSYIKNAVNAKLVSISGDQLFKYDKDNVLVSPSLLTLTADVQGVSVSKWQYKNSSGAYVDYPTTSDNTNITGQTLKVGPAHAIFTNNVAVVKVLTNDANVYDTITITKLYDGVTGAVGQGGLSTIIGNESQQISCTNAGAASGVQTITIPFKAYKGIVQIPATISAGTLPSGMTITTNTAATSSAEGSLVLSVANGATLGGANQGEITLTFTLTSEGNQTVSHKFNWSKSIKGDTGVSSVILTLTTPNGNVINNGQGSILIKSYGYEGTTEIQSGATYAWRKYTAGNWTTISGQTGRDLTVTASDILNISSFECTMTYKSQSYKSVVTLMDKTDPCVSEMIALKGTVFKNGLGGTPIYIEVRRNGEIIDPLKGPISTTTPLSPKSGDFWWEVNETTGACTLKKYNGTAWAEVTTASDKQTLVYRWYKRDKNGADDDLFSKTGKVIYLNASDVDSTASITCDVSDS